MGLLTGASFIKANLRGANLYETGFSEANLSNTYLTGADLTGANLIGADLSYANLSEVNLSRANLSGTNFEAADLTGANLIGADLSYANLRGARLYEAKLPLANLRGANLSRAFLYEVELWGANMTEANLSSTYLKGADLRGANLSRADLGGANLTEALLITTNLREVNLIRCTVYGTSVWNVDLEGATQDSLVITPDNEPTITVDNLKIAQFIYLLLNNKEIRDVIDTITSKVVLILGRFTPERKAILDAIRDELRKRNYLPVLFDFEKPASRDITETVSTLAHMARFVIADITDAKSIPQELMTIVPNLPSVSVQPLILASQHEYGMFEHFTRFPWVLPLYRYLDEASLLQTLIEKVITPAEQKAKELEKR